MTTVGDLKRLGKNGLYIRCTGCGFTVVSWWKTMGVPDDRDIDAIIGKLQCKRCGTRPRPLDVRPYEQGEDAPDCYPTGR